ncbi:hypothetical protein BDQ17DRAFT_537986 [Cyathus striatus]|nr:hypothetical protein BDQ17DRAFT_537986 [Cyathus striatus]
MNEKYSSVSPDSPASNQIIPLPFTAHSEPRPMDFRGGSSAPASSGYTSTSDIVPTIGYGIGTSKTVANKHRYMPSVPSSVAPSSSIDMTTPDSPPSAARPTRQREMDAGPIVFEDEDEEEGTLPPEYGQVFANSSSRAAPELLDKCDTCKKIMID